MSLLYEIVSKIADRDGADPTELDPLLSEAVDVEALEALTTNPRQQGGPCPLVEFVYDGRTVKIGTNRNVTISESTTTDVISKNEAQSPLKTISAKLDYHETAMRDVADIISARGRPFDKQLDGLLEVVRKALGVESATLSYVDNDSYVFEAVDVGDTGQDHAGEIIPLKDTVCEWVVENEQTLVLSDVTADAPVLANSTFTISSYLGVPVFVDGEAYGTLCFYDRDTRADEFSEWELAFVEILRNWVSSELEQRQRERTVHASTTERPYAGTTAD